MAGETGHFDFGGVRFGMMAWRASALGAGKGGGAAAPVVLLHGFAQSAASWDEVADAIAHEMGRPVLALDSMGHGESDRPDSDGPYDLGFQARAVLAFCEFAAQTEGERPMLVGYSMGGRVALQAACLAVGGLRSGSGASVPKDGVPFSALVLESAGLGPVDNAEREALRERNFAWAQRVRREGVPDFMEWWENLPLFESQRKLDEVVQARLRAGRLANDAESLALAFERAGAHAMPLRQEAVGALCALARWGVPVSYLAGELDAKYLKALDALHEETRGFVSCHVIPNAGHNIHLERPESFVRAVGGILCGQPPRNDAE